jgi:hypothetical protein
MSVQYRRIAEDHQTLRRGVWMPMGFLRNQSANVAVSLAGSAEKEITNEDLESHCRNDRLDGDWVRRCNGSGHEPGYDAKPLGNGTSDDGASAFDNGSVEFGFEFG